ncbi:MAG: glycosyltransferase [Candidatus Magasanikbacteria bacterium]|nr:glycosyltransferase [Candidatus Magasanikbacteria bacterium]
MIDKKIKILFVANALEVGGAEKFLLDLLKHLDRSVFEPSLATVIGGGSLLKDFQSLNLPLYIHGIKRVRYLGGVVQFWQLYKLMKQLRPDIVHTQLFAADLWGRLAAWAAGVPIIITTEQNVNIDQSWLRETLKMWTYRLTTQVVAISTAVKNYAIKRYCLPADKIIIIPNDVDLAALEKRFASAPPKPTDKKIIINTGRLVPQKGQKYLLEAFALLPQKNNYELWLAGNGPLKKELETQAQKLGITSQVKFLGTRHDVPELLAQAHLFAFSSIFEGLGIAVLEAAAAKLPIVASKIDGILDIIKDGESGLLVEPKNPVVLAKAMEELLNNEEKAKLMAMKAYENIKNNFDISVVVKKYEDLFKKIYEDFANK